MMPSKNTVRTEVFVGHGINRRWVGGSYGGGGVCGEGDGRAPVGNSGGNAPA